MNKNIFLIFGYGIPKNILKDDNYNFYLKIVFNQVYSIVVKNNIPNPLIICSGGKTDCYPPYKRNEAEEMIKLLKSFTKQPILKESTKDWTLIPENKSLSTLENFLLSKKIMQKRKINKANVYIFCEQTREKRVKILARKVLNKNHQVKVLPIDFDTSSNRYLDPKFIENKEKEVLNFDLWALKSKSNLKEYHQAFEEKISFLRKAGPKKHQKAIKQWWTKKLNEIKHQK